MFYNVKERTKYFTIVIVSARTAVSGLFRVNCTSWKPSSSTAIRRLAPRVSNSKPASLGCPRRSRRRHLARVSPPRHSRCALVSAVNKRRHKRQLATPRAKPPDALRSRAGALLTMTTNIVRYPLWPASPDVSSGIATGMASPAPRAAPYPPLPTHLRSGESADLKMFILRKLSRHRRRTSPTGSKRAGASCLRTSPAT